MDGIRKEYYIFSLSGSITKNNEIWLVDNGASRHMIGYWSTLTDLSEKESSLHVELGDDARYAVKGVGFTSLLVGLWRHFAYEWHSICSKIEEEPPICFNLGGQSLQSCLCGWKGPYVS